MAYSLHIEREDSPIDLREWRAAVESRGDLRMAEGDATLVNPRTAETIMLRNLGGDTELLFPSGEWVRALFWKSAGTVSFRGDLLSGDDAAELAKVVFSVAHDLGAHVVGDDGEEYGPDSFGHDSSANDSPAH